MSDKKVWIWLIPLKLLDKMEYDAGSGGLEGNLFGYISYDDWGCVYLYFPGTIWTREREYRDDDDTPHPGWAAGEEEFVRMNIKYV